MARKVSYRLIDQFVSSAVSVGANVEEGQAAQSKADFISKMSIALKESREAVFRLRVFIASGVVTESRAGMLRDEGMEIKRVLGKIVANAARNARR